MCEHQNVWQRGDYIRPFGRIYICQDCDNWLMHKGGKLVAVEKITSTQYLDNLEGEGYVKM